VEYSVILSLIKLARLHAVFVGFFMFLIGALLACISGAPFTFMRFILGYAILFTAQLSVSYSNDYFDVITDQYSAKNLFSGGSKVLVEHPELRHFAKWFAVGLMVLSVGLAAVFTVVFSFSVFFLLFVIVGNIIGWFYTAPPVRLSYRGLGEMTTMLVIGFFIPELGYWAIKGGVDEFYLLFVVPFSLYGLALIINVEVPDREADARANKKNLIVRKGRGVGLLVSACALLLASLYFVACSLVIGGYHGIDFRLVTLASFIPLGAGLGALLKRNAEPAILHRFVFATIAALFVLVLLVDAYLFDLAAF
jgi:1,4-dihydroxy-2-naphthoate octaprenyltransferase